MRNRIKEFGSQNAKVKELVSVVSHNSTPKRTKNQAREEIIAAVERMRMLSEITSLTSDVTKKFKRRVDNIEKNIFSKSNDTNQNTLSCLSPTQRKIADEIFDLIYAVSPQKNNARLLIDKVTKRLVKSHNS